MKYQNDYVTQIIEIKTSDNLKKQKLMTYQLIIVNEMLSYGVRVSLLTSYILDSLEQITPQISIWNELK